MAQYQFVGSGLAFPVHVGRTGEVALVDGERELEQSIALILCTIPGERPMRPEFGCRIHDYVFAPADATTAGLLAYEVRQSLLRWEPRIDVIDVVVTPEREDAGVLLIDIRYTVRSTNDPRNLVFPFYVIPDEPAAVLQLEGKAVPS
jgi:phage baseplate assembly protein W